jgi:multiple sugar transport system permease protein
MSSTSLATPAGGPGGASRHDPVARVTTASRIGHATVKAISYTALVGFALLTLMPFIWMISTAFKPNELSMEMPPVIIPDEPTLKNFEVFFRQRDTFRWILNSIITVSLITVGHVFLYTTAGYALAKLSFPGKRLVFALVIIALTIPLYVIVVPLYQLMFQLGWMNTYAALIVPALVGPANLFLMKQFMQTLPSSLIDSARVDACPEWRIFLRVVLPIAKPGIAVLAIFTFMGYWNSFFWPLIVTQTSEMRTLTVGLTSVRYGNFDYGSLMAGSVVAAAPMFLVFLVFQRYFLKGLTIGAVKG